MSQQQDSQTFCQYGEKCKFKHSVQKDKSEINCIHYIKGLYNPEYHECTNKNSKFKHDWVAGKDKTTPAFPN